MITDYKIMMMNHRWNSGETLEEGAKQPETHTRTHNSASPRPQAQNDSKLK